MNLNKITIEDKLKKALESSNLPKSIFYFFKLYKADKNPRHLISIGDIFKDCNKYTLAIKYYSKIKTYSNLAFLSSYLCMTCFPIVYKNNNERSDVLNNFKKFLSDCEELLKLEKTLNNLDKGQFLIIIERSLFYLSYSGINIKSFQERYQKINRLILDYFLPIHEIDKSKLKSKIKKIKKIAFCSRDLKKDHTLIKLFKFLMDFFVNNPEYEVFFFSYTKHDFYYLDKKNVHFFYGNSFQKVQLEILKESIDLLIYLDIGMSRYNSLISNYRIAKIQIATWGHPVTSGSKEIDYFITSELMESKNNLNHYSEKLIFFPGAGFNYDFSHMKKYSINVAKTKNITCLQPPNKISSETLLLFEKISKQNPGYYLNFIGTNNPYLNRNFKKILEKYFDQNKFSIYEKMSHQQYSDLIKNSKVILDTLGWSGGNSTLEALYFNRPVVTMRGNSLRSNHTSGILKALDLDILCAQNEKEYLEIFLKLIEDEKFYQYCSGKIKENKTKLSKQVTDNFLESFVQKITLGTA